MSKQVLIQASRNNHKCIGPELRLNKEVNYLELTVNKINHNMT